MIKSSMTSNSKKPPVITLYRIFAGTFFCYVCVIPEIHFLRTGILAVALCHAKDRIGRCSNEAAEQSIGHMHPCVVVVENFSSNWSGRL